MKQNLKYLLTITASTLLLAGCCTARHDTQWEYKMGYPPPHDFRHPEVAEAFVNNLAKDGWIFIETTSDGIYIFKRAKK